MEIDIRCLNCRLEFVSTDDAIREGYGNFCSINCFNKFQNKKHEDTNRNNQSFMAQETPLSLSQREEDY